MNNKKYELLTNDTINVYKGDLGGYIEKEDNLSYEGDCWIYDDNARVFNNAKIYGHVNVVGNAKVFGEKVTMISKAMLLLCYLIMLIYLMVVIILF